MRFLSKISAASYSKAEAQQLRKDFLTLMKAAEKESSIEEAKQVANALAVFRRHVDELLYKKIAPEIEKKSKLLPVAYVFLARIKR